MSATPPVELCGPADDACDAAGGPLVRLLDLLAHAYVAEFTVRAATSEFAGLSLAHSKNVLRTLTDGPLRASQITDACGVSKQAVSQQLVHLERAGYIELTSDPADRRARVIGLTELGARAQQFVHETFEAIESDWSERLGADGPDLRRILERAVSELVD